MTSTSYGFTGLIIDYVCSNLIYIYTDDKFYKYDSGTQLWDQIYDIQDSIRCLIKYDSYLHILAQQQLSKFDLKIFKNFYNNPSYYLLVNNIVDGLKIECYVDNINFNNFNNLLTDNKLINLNSIKDNNFIVRNIKPKDYCTQKLSIKYYPTLNTSMVIAYFMSLVKGNTQEYNKFHMTLGACLSGFKPIETMILIQGPNNSGKTVLRRIIQDVLGYCVLYLSYDKVSYTNINNNLKNYHRIICIDGVDYNKLKEPSKINVNMKNVLFLLFSDLNFEKQIEPEYKNRFTILNLNNKFECDNNEIINYVLSKKFKEAFLTWILEGRMKYL